MSIRVIVILFSMSILEANAYTGYVIAEERVERYMQKDSLSVWYEITENSIIRGKTNSDGYKTAIAFFPDKNEVRVYALGEGLKVYTSMTLRKYQQFLAQLDSDGKDRHYIGASTYFKSLNHKSRHFNLKKNHKTLEGKPCHLITFIQKRAMKERGEIEFCEGLVPMPWLRVTEWGMPEYVTGFPVRFVLNPVAQENKNSSDQLKKSWSSISHKLGKTKNVFSGREELFYKVNTTRTYRPNSWPGEFVGGTFKRLASITALRKAIRDAEKARIDREYEEREAHCRENECRSSSDILEDIFD